MKIYYTFPNLENPFWQQIVEGLKEKAAAEGLQVELLPAGDDESRQVADLEKLLGRKSEVFAVSPAGMSRLKPLIRRMIDAELRIIAIDYNIGENVTASIISGNTQGGMALGNFLASRLRQAGRVVHLQAQLDLQSAIMRRNSFLSVCQKSRLEIVAAIYAGGSRGLARSEMEAFLRQGTPFDGVFAENDVMALGVVDALSVHKPHAWPMIVGFDGIPEAIQNLRQGRLAATVMQKPREMGEKAAEIAGKISRNLPFDKLTTILTHLITRENVDQYYPV